MTCLVGKQAVKQRTNHPPIHTESGWLVGWLLGSPFTLKIVAREATTHPLELYCRPSVFSVRHHDNFNQPLMVMMVNILAATRGTDGTHIGHSRHSWWTHATARARQDRLHLVGPHALVTPPPRSSFFFFRGGGSWSTVTDEDLSADANVATVERG